jgi:putative aldouronate transport system substrate-binding protein
MVKFMRGGIFMLKPGFKRILTILIAIILVVSFAACKGQTDDKGKSGTTKGTTKGTTGTQQGGKTTTEEKSYFNKEGFPICDETITITVSGAQSTTPDWNDTLMVEEIEKRFGIRMECSPVPDEAWSTQLTLMLSTNELPDFIINVGMSLLDAARHGQDGLLLPFNQYIEYAPNMVSVFNDYPALERSVTAPDGNIYGLVQLMDNKIGQVPRSFIDKNWMEGLNLPYPETVDDIYDILAAFRDNDANGNGDPDDEIPFSAIIGSLDFFHHIFLASFDLIGNQHYFNLQADDNGKVFLVEAADNYRNYLKFLHQLYDEKLLDQDCFIQTREELDAKIREGRVGMFGHWAPFVAAGQNIDFDTNYIWAGGLTSEYNETPTVPLSSQIGNTVMCVASANTEYPEAIVRLIDYFYTQEGEFTTRMGFQGVSWDYVDVEGVPDAKVAEVFHPEGYDSGENFRTKKALINNIILISRTQGTSYGVIENATSEQLDDILLEKYGWSVLIQKYCLNRPGIVLSPVFPGLVYSNEESDIITPIKNDITLFVENSKAMFVTGESDIDSDSDWNDYISRMEKMGLGKMLEAVQAAYDRYMGK